MSELLNEKFQLVFTKESDFNGVEMCEATVQMMKCE